MAATYCTSAWQLGAVFAAAGLGQGVAMAFVMVAFTDAFGMLALHRCIGAISFMTGTGLMLVPKIAGASRLPFVWKSDHLDIEILQAR